MLPFVTRRSRSLFTRPVMWAVIVTRAVMVLGNSEYIISHTDFSGYRHATKKYSRYQFDRMHAYHGVPDRHDRYSQSLLGSRPQHWLRFPLEEPIVIRNHLLGQAQLVILDMLTIRCRFNLQLICSQPLQRYPRRLNPRLPYPRCPQSASRPVIVSPFTARPVTGFQLPDAPMKFSSHCSGGG